MHTRVRTIDSNGNCIKLMIDIGERGEGGGRESRENIVEVMSTRIAYRHVGSAAEVNV